MFSTPLFVVSGTLCKMRLGGSFCLREGGFRGSCKSTSKVRPSEASARTMPFSTEVTRASMYAWAGSLTQQRPPTSDEDHCVEWFILDILVVFRQVLWSWFWGAADRRVVGRLRPGAVFGFGGAAARPRRLGDGALRCGELCERWLALACAGRGPIPQAFLNSLLAPFQTERARWARFQRCRTAYEKRFERTRDLSGSFVEATVRCARTSGAFCRSRPHW